MTHHTETISVTETGQVIHVELRPLPSGNVSLSLDGVADEYPLERLRATARRHEEPHVRRFWTRVADLAEGALARDRRERERREARARRQRIERCRGHRAESQSEPRCFVGPVARAPHTDENPAAHGGIEVTETCRCGATRGVLINGRHEEQGPWG